MAHPLEASIPLLLFATGCLQTLDITLPSSESAIISIENGSTHLLAVETVTEIAAVIGFAAAVDSQVTILQYEEPLAELNLVPGEVPFATKEPFVRPLPIPEKIHQARMKEGATFATIPELSDSLEKVRIPAVSPQDCAETGCVEEKESRICTFCSEVQVDVVPDPVNPPVFTPCTHGWQETELQREGETVLAACLPPELDCGPYEASFLGPDCDPIGDPCPGGDVPADLPLDATVLRVGNGHYGSIEAALQDAPRGAIVAIGRGTFAAPTRLEQPVTLWGLCAEETIVQTTVPITTTTSGIALRNLQINSEAATLIVSSGSVAIDGVLIDGSGQGSSSIEIRGGSVDATELVLRSPSDTGLRVTGGSRFAAAGLVIDGPQTFGIFGHASELELQDTLIRGPISGIHADEGVRADLRRVVVEDCDQGGIEAEKADLSLVDTIIRRTGREAVNQTSTDAIAVNNGSLSASRLLLESNRGCGIASEGSRFQVADLGIVHIEEAYGGMGIVTINSTGQLERARVVDSTVFGVVLQGGIVTLMDLDVWRTRQTNTTNGWGLLAKNEVEAIVTRAHLRGNEVGGAVAVAPGDTRLVIQDAVIEGNMEGLRFEAGAVGEVHRSIIRDHRTFGITAIDQADLSLAGVVVQNVGIHASYDAHVQARRFVLESCKQGMVVDFGATVALRDGIISKNSVGVAVYGPSFDLYGLLERVRYQDNDLNIVVED